MSAHFFARDEEGLAFLRRAAEAWGGGGEDFEDLEIYDGGVSLLMHAGDWWWWWFWWWWWWWWR